MEAEILSEIKEAEKKADEIIEMAKKESESILHNAAVNSSKLLTERQEEIKKSKEKKIMDFRDKAKLIKEEKLAEGKVMVKQIKSKAEKNISKAIDFVLQKFEETI